MSDQKPQTGSLDRRDFLKTTAVAGAVVGAASLGLPPQARAAGPVELIKLPYAPKALEPYISARTIGFHYGKHHAAYVKNTIALAKKMGLAKEPLVRLIQLAAKDPQKQGLFNNAAQVFNHAFYWQSLKPQGGGKPTGKLLKMIEASFGSFDKFTPKFAAAAAGQFGSGWAWLVQDGQKLKIITTANADTPVAHGQKPLLTIDVWEHAYYLDYQNRRPDYLKDVITHLLNWSFAAKNLV